MKSTNATRRKVRDHLEGNGVPRVRRKGDSIQIRLLALINHGPLHNISAIASGASTYTSPQGSLSSSGKRDFLKSNHNENNIYQGLYIGPILSAVRRKFDSACTAYDIPGYQRISVLPFMSSEDADRYFTKHVASHATDIDDAFKRMDDHFRTPADEDKYTTEWNTLSFLDIKRKNTDLNASRCLDILSQRARDLRSLLDYACQFPPLLCDCVIKTVTSESFYTPPTAG